MSLGNYVRILRTFVDAFTAAIQPIKSQNGDGMTTSNEEPEVSTETETDSPSEMRDLMLALKVRRYEAIISDDPDLISGISEQAQQIWPERRSHQATTPTASDRLQISVTSSVVLDPLHHITPWSHTLFTYVHCRQLQSEQD